MQERPLSDLFSFSKKEQVGVAVLSVGIIACLIFINTYDFFAQKKTIDKSNLEERIAALTLAKDSIDKSYQNDKIYTERTSPRKEYSSKKRLSDPFVFDPNTISKDKLVELGFSDKQAASIDNYRTKGGVIYKKEDFKKIYVVNDFMYGRLVDFIQIAPIAKKPRGKKTYTENWETRKDSSFSASESRSFGKSSSIETANLPLDLNSATAEQLMALQGIGPVYSKLILKYKDVLGGFADPSQLSEVYLIKDHPEIVKSLIPKLKADQSLIDKININTADWKTLVSHLYIDKNVANSILAMRQTHGPFKSVDEVQKSHLVNADLYGKIAPYLTVNANQ